MKQINLPKVFLGVVMALSISSTVGAAEMDAQSQATFDTVMAFMNAVGTGDMATAEGLMAEDMVWHNEGDSTMPWIGPWNGKQAILKFLPIFGENFQNNQMGEWRCLRFRRHGSCVWKNERYNYTVWPGDW